MIHGIRWVMLYCPRQKLTNVRPTWWHFWLAIQNGANCTNLGLWWPLRLRECLKFWAKFSVTAAMTDFCKPADRVHWSTWHCMHWQHNSSKPMSGLWPKLKMDDASWWWGLFSYLHSSPMIQQAFIAQSDVPQQFYHTVWHRLWPKLFWTHLAVWLARWV